MTKKTLQNVVLYAYKSAICYETEEHNRYKVWYTILSNQEFIEIIKLYSHFITQNNKSITEDKLRKILIDVCGEEYLHYKMFNVV